MKGSDVSDSLPVSVTCDWPLTTRVIDVFVSMRALKRACVNVSPCYYRREASRPVVLNLGCRYPLGVCGTFLEFREMS